MLHSIIKHLSGSPVERSITPVRPNFGHIRENKYGSLILAIEVQQRNVVHVFSRCLYVKKSQLLMKKK